MPCCRRRHPAYTGTVDWKHKTAIGGGNKVHCIGKNTRKMTLGTHAAWVEDFVSIVVRVIKESSLQNNTKNMQTTHPARSSGIIKGLIHRDGTCIPQQTGVQLSRLGYHASLCKKHRAIEMSVSSTQDMVGWVHRHKVHTCEHSWAR